MLLAQQLGFHLLALGESAGFEEHVRATRASQCADVGQDTGLGAYVGTLVAYLSCLEPEDG